MAWGEIRIMEQREAFVKAVLEGNLSIAELCRQYDISRNNGYKWLNRYKEEGIQGLANRSRAPYNQPLRIDPEVVNSIIELKLDWPKWGPKKVKGRLVLDHPEVAWPSTTTIGNLFDQYGLTMARKYRKRVPGKTRPLAHCLQPNDVWCMDFKGWFLTSDGEKFDPFTLTDGDTRFILRCLKLPSNNTEHVWGVLDTAFREYGLPSFLRSDNGPPFASTGPGRLSRLSVMLVKAGVMPEWIDPGEPQQNGRHERMHLTLQQDVGNSPQFTLPMQLKKLKKFVYEFNFVRPHEALNQVPPGTIYSESPRQWSGKLKSPEYASNCEVRKVRSCGSICWKYENIFLGRCLTHEYVGLTQSAEGAYEVRYGPIILGTIDHNKEFTVPCGNKRKRNPHFNGGILTLGALPPDPQHKE